jgi:hypothetical protein
MMDMPITSDRADKQRANSCASNRLFSAKGFGQKFTVTQHLKRHKQPWTDNFHTMYSKNNDKFPKMLREMFDKPIKYQTNGIYEHYEHPYGWDMLENNNILPEMRHNMRLSLNTKLSKINTDAFRNFMATQRSVRKIEPDLIAKLSPVERAQHKNRKGFMVMI